MTDAMDAVATSFPKSKFAIVDVDVSTLKHKPKNVEGLLFREQQAGYLVGYAAGLWTKQHGGAAVGSVGGIKIPPVDRYIAGFQYGAKKADPGIKTLNAYSQELHRSVEVQGERRSTRSPPAPTSSSRSPARAASVCSTRRTARTSSASASTPTRATSARG